MNKMLPNSSPLYFINIEKKSLLRQLISKALSLISFTEHMGYLKILKFYFF